MSDNSIIILSIETATPVCSIAIHENGVLKGGSTLHLDASHSSLLHPMIKQLLESLELSFDQLNAVAISEGPGSYTGLRIGLSAAKGLCYTNDIQLIAVNTLEALAKQVSKHHAQPALFCPMIDARRKEVFCLVTNEKGEIIVQSNAHILDENSFTNLNPQLPFYFFGNGAEKAVNIIPKSKNGFVAHLNCQAETVGEIAYQYYQKDQFVNLAYFEPNYLKEFYSPPSKKKNNILIYK